MTNFTAADRTARAHARAVALHAEIAALSAKLDKEKETLAAAGSGKHTTPHGAFTVSENNVYAEAAIVAALGPGQLRRVQTLKVDKAKVKVLYPEVYTAAKDTKGFKVSL